MVSLKCFALLPNELTSANSLKARAGQPLTRDARMVERKKPGLKKARKATILKTLINTIISTFTNIQVISWIITHFKSKFTQKFTPYSPHQFFGFTKTISPTV